MVLFIVHCFPRVNGIFALPLAKASLFQSFILASGELLPEGAWKTLWVGRDKMLYTDFEEGSLFEHGLVASRTSSWVLGIQLLDMVARSQLGGGESRQKKVNDWIHMEGLNF